MAVSAVSEDLSSSMSVQRRIQPTYGYYRQPNGWLTVSTITRLERVNYIEQGWQHLGQYGAFDMSPYVANHPFEGLFMFGGAKELAVEQILQMGLHLAPPMVPVCRQHMTQFHRSHTANCWAGARPVEFPQLAGMDPALLKGYPCEFCERTLPTVEARKQHQQVAHKEEIGHLQAGRSLAGAIAEVKPVAFAAAVQPDVSALLDRIDRLERQLAEQPPKETPKRDRTLEQQEKRREQARAWKARQREQKKVSKPVA